jgi:tRNA (cmo5U34)-methyltransferase
MGQVRWTPECYLELMRAEVPAFGRLQDAAAEATAGVRARAILELGIGTGETARRVLDRHPGAHLLGVDASEGMLAAAASALDGRAVTLRAGRLEDPLPAGPFDLAVSALTVHHLDAAAKADLFGRVAAELRPGGRFVLADVVVPDDPADATTPLDPAYDRPDTLADQLAWLVAAGFAARATWTHRDLAVVAAELPPGA